MPKNSKKKSILEKAGVPLDPRKYDKKKLLKNTTRTLISYVPVIGEMISAREILKTSQKEEPNKKKKR